MPNQEVLWIQDRAPNWAPLQGGLMGKQKSWRNRELASRIMDKVCSKEAEMLRERKAEKLSGTEGVCVCVFVGMRGRCIETKGPVSQPRASTPHRSLVPGSVFPKGEGPQYMQQQIIWPTQFWRRWLSSFSGFSEQLCYYKLCGLRFINAKTHITLTTALCEHWGATRPQGNSITTQAVGWFSE